MAEHQPEAAETPGLTDDTAQKYFDGSLLEQALQAARQQLAQAKVAYALSTKGIGDANQHPTQIKQGIAKLTDQLGILAGLYAECESSTTGLAVPSDIEIPESSTVSELNRAQRRHRG